MDFLRRNIALVSLCLLSLIAFLSTTFFVATGYSFAFDSKVNFFIAHFHREAFTNVMLSISKVLHPAVLILSSSILFSVLMFFKKKLFAYYLLIAMGVGVTSSTLFKIIFSVVRPTSELASAIGWSYPSGHATAAAIFFITIFYAVEKKITDRTIEVLVLTVSIILIMLTALSRVYLGVHWFSDVFGGTMLGIFWATLSILMLKRRLESYEIDHS